MKWSNDLESLRSELDLISSQLATLAHSISEKGTEHLYSKENIADVIFSSVNHLERISEDIENYQPQAKRMTETVTKTLFL